MKFCCHDRWCSCPVVLLPDSLKLLMLSILKADSIRVDCGLPILLIKGTHSSSSLEFSLHARKFDFISLYHSFGNQWSLLLCGSSVNSKCPSKPRCSMWMTCLNYQNWALMTMDSMFEEWSWSWTSIRFQE